MNPPVLSEDSGMNPFAAMTGTIRDVKYTKFNEKKCCLAAPVPSK